MPPILLLTRPAPQSRRFAARAASALPPHETLIAPLSEVAPLPYDATAFDGAQGLVLTSANAIPMLPALPGLPAWCVGPATTAAARDAGFDAREAGGDAAALIERLKTERPHGPWVHAHGKHQARDLVAALRPHGLDLRGVAVYEARALDWTDAIRARLENAERVIAPLFSPRAAEGFLRNMARVEGMDPRRVTPVAISRACANRLPAALKARTRIADGPNGDAMLRSLGEALSHPGSFA